MATSQLVQVDRNEKILDMHGSIVDPDQYEEAGRTLLDTSARLAKRYRALYLLRNVFSRQSVDIIGGTLKADNSALLKHDLAFCLGQMGHPEAIEILEGVLKSESQPSIVRHEAAEALAALGNEKAIDILKLHVDDKSKEVRQTIELALQRLEYVKDHASSDEKIAATKSPYESVDPTPAMDSKDVAKLESILLDEKQSLWDRYGAMFALRNINSNESNIALAKALCCEDSALLRHEVAYVLGQTQNPVVFDQLRKSLEDENENCMVRHEAAEALGSLVSEDGEALLVRYAKDKDDVVRESCEVALDMMEYERSGSFQYASLN